MNRGWPHSQKNISRNEYQLGGVVKGHNFFIYHLIKFEFAEFSNFYYGIKGED
jgi:hypothetical protein